MARQPEFSRAASRVVPLRPATLETSIIVPIYNEAARLPATLPRLLALAGPHTELLLVDDGSRDRTADLLAECASLPNVHVLAFRDNRGKGAAIRSGVAASRGRTLVFMDADLATDLSSLRPLLDALDAADIAIGSRAHASSKIHDATQRRSRLGGNFNRLVRGVTGIQFRDTQCGFKAFRAQTAKALFALGGIDGFAFDVELLVLAQRYGARVVEVPVDWTEMRGSTVRALIDPCKMAFDVMRTRMTPPGAAAMQCLRVSASPDRTREVVSIIRSQVRVSDLVVEHRDDILVVLPNTSNGAAVSERVCSRTFALGTDVTLEIMSLRSVLRSNPDAFSSHTTTNRVDHRPVSLGAH